ncbi:hypothetical protein GPALN_003279 [Globodera pallida]|nr:hypothetical protein GPALN_003279 [Globodera pallida]
MAAKRHWELSNVFFTLDKARFFEQEALRWANEKCRQNGKKCSAKNRRAMLGPALFKIRFPLIPQKDFNCSVCEQFGVCQYHSHAALPDLYQLQFSTNGRAIQVVTLPLTY